MRTCFSRVEEILGGGKRLAGRFDGGALLELIITSCKRAPRPRGEKGAQQKVTNGTNGRDLSV